MLAARLSALFALLFLFAAPAMAQDSPPAAPDMHSAVRLYSPVLAVGDGDSVPAALEVTLQDDWKTYWRTPGDSGLAPVIDGKGSENLADITVHYPAPHRFTILDLDNFGYKHRVTFPLDLKLATPGQPLEARLRVDLLVCAETCVPESHEVTLSLPAGPAASSPDAAAHAAALLAVPHSGPMPGYALGTSQLTVSADNRIYLVTTGKMAEKPSADADLFVEESSGRMVVGRPEIKYDDATGDVVFTSLVSTTLPYEKAAETFAAAKTTYTYVDGDLSFDTGVDRVAAPAVAEAEAVVENAAESMPAITLELLFYAFLGGLILNLMPCVLPVLSLKVISVLNHGGAKTDRQSRHKVFVHFMASALGILVSFWILAAGLVGLKLAGESVGWGIQFQHPSFLVFLIVVILAFALNMWGLYEIPLPRFIAHRVGRRGHDSEPTVVGDFLTGAFATLLATPCTAPFLGTAIGFALAGGAFDIFTIFTFLGLGLALPYILLAAMPRLFRFLPRPGKWMLTLRRILAVALLATAAWLASTLYTVTTQPTLDSGWQAFDQSRIAPAVEDGKVVFVDITADWCLTCKANKRLVIDTDEVQAALNQPHIVKMQGDWTQQDEVIATYLRSFGKFGIPFNIVYGPAAPQGVVLPELLTQRAVTDAIATATGE